ncbi:MAG: hypothetical protein QNJ92_00890 [Alphaproteobacteria bacterium]|nr:hypothetical protein [Alphaproteobacteria bacterium]
MFQKAAVAHRFRFTLAKLVFRVLAFGDVDAKGRETAIEGMIPGEDPSPVVKLVFDVPLGVAGVCTLAQEFRRIGTAPKELAPAQGLAPQVFEARAKREIFGDLRKEVPISTIAEDEASLGIKHTYPDLDIVDGLHQELRGKGSVARPVSLAVPAFGCGETALERDDLVDQRGLGKLPEAEGSWLGGHGSPLFD